MLRIGKAAVLGAGTMGAGIAAHLANAGIPTLLLDIAPKDLTPDEEKRRKQFTRLVWIAQVLAAMIVTILIGRWLRS